LIESSRGCWWGQKHQCTFCGLNAHGLDYRAKSGERVVGEVVELACKHRTLRVDAVDNVIDSRSRDQMCSLLSATGYDFDLFYEVKTNLTRADIRALRAAGVRSVQPGVESLRSREDRLLVRVRRPRCRVCQRAPTAGGRRGWLPPAVGGQAVDA
jgi:radical SAM superfamily enzyme YgiQ (UPF0313 family)